MLILILHEIMIKGDSLQDVFSPLVVALLVGKLPYTLRLLCQLLRQSIWLLQRFQGSYLVEGSIW